MAGHPVSGERTTWQNANETPGDRGSRFALVMIPRYAGVVSVRISAVCAASVTLDTKAPESVR
jgi:hypothetical protein